MGGTTIATNPIAATFLAGYALRALRVSWAEVNNDVPVSVNINELRERWESQGCPLKLDVGSQPKITNKEEFFNKLENKIRYRLYQETVDINKYAFDNDPIATGEIPIDNNTCKEFQLGTVYKPSQSGLARSMRSASKYS